VTIFPKFQTLQSIQIGYVDVRVPPFRAVQILGGTTHRRGTPPAVVEMSAKTWLELFTKKLTWADAVSSGQVVASGERSNLSKLSKELY